jgi:putative spermidine/putrescine transport system permease protein
VPVRIAALVSGDISLDPNMGSALAILLVLLMAVITLVHQWLLRRSYLNVR